MAFKGVFLAHVPDADPKKHRCVVETNMYKLFAVLVRNQKQAVDVCKRLVKEEGIHSIILCPGFTHRDIAQISEVVGKDVGVSVARGDGSSMRVAQKVMEKEGWFSG
jgi:pyruvate kinase